jgi:hypothetical protein
MIRIIFLGLIAFVPSADDKKQCALLVDASRPLDYGGHTIPAHHAAIRVHRDRVDTSTGRRQPDDYVGPEDQYAVFYLRDEIVRLEPEHSGEAPSPPLRIPEKPDPRKPCCTNAPGENCSGGNQCVGTPPYEQQRKDYDWVLPLGETVPTAARAKGDCFEVDPPDEDIQAQVHLPAGKLFTLQLEGEPDPKNTDTDKIALIVFPGADGFEPRAAARRVALEVGVVGDGEPALRIRSRIIGSDVDLPVIRLQGKDGLLDVMVMNSAAPQLDDPDHVGTRPAPHFVHFYRLSATEIADDKWLIPRSFPFQGELLCPPVRMQQ